MLTVGVSCAFDGAPSVSCKLKQACYDSNSSLMRCVLNTDVPGFRQLFAEGEARPADCLAPWDNSLLHVT